MVIYGTIHPKGETFEPPETCHNAKGEDTEDDPLCLL